MIFVWHVQFHSPKNKHIQNVVCWVVHNRPYPKMKLSYGELRQICKLDGFHFISTVNQQDLHMLDFPCWFTMLGNNDSPEQITSQEIRSLDSQTEKNLQLLASRGKPFWYASDKEGVPSSTFSGCLNMASSYLCLVGNGEWPIRTIHDHPIPQFHTKWIFIPESLTHPNFLDGLLFR